MCGVFGAVLPGGEPTDAASIAALGLFALQHRGQESAGLAVSDGEQLMLYKDLGHDQLGPRRAAPPEPPRPAGDRPLPLLDDRLDGLGERPADVPPRARAGRSPSATTATSSTPASCSASSRAAGPACRPRTDTELLTALLADEPAADTVEALQRVLPRVRGAYSLVVLDERRVIGVRDPFGFRPLVLGPPARPQVGRRRRRPVGGDDAAVGWCLSSETAGLDIVGAEYVRDVEPGELVILEPGAGAALGPLRRGPARAVRLRADLLRPARLVHGGPQPVRGAPPDGDAAGGGAPGRRRPGDAGARTPAPRRRPASPRRPGSRTARGCTATATPGGRSSSRPPALRHRGRDGQAQPAAARSSTASASIVVDDSIVRGTTTKRIVELLRKAGATEVHVRISAPPIYHPCFYGIDTQVETELIAADPHGGGDPRVHRRRFARLPVDPRRARRRSTCRTSGSASPASTATTRSRSRTTRPAASSSSKSRSAIADERRPTARGLRTRTARRASTSRPASAPWTCMRGACRVDAPARGRRRARRVRRRLRHPGRLPRAAARRLDRRRRDQDRDRRGASAGSTRSASTSWRCAPTTSCAPAPSRSPSSTTSRSGELVPGWPWPSSSAGWPPAAARRAARSSAARRPSTRA